MIYNGRHSKDSQKMTTYVVSQVFIKANPTRLSTSLLCLMGASIHLDVLPVYIPPVYTLSSTSCSVEANHLCLQM